MSTEPTPTTPGFEALGLKPELLSTIAALYRLNTLSLTRRYRRLKHEIDAGLQDEVWERLAPRDFGDEVARLSESDLPRLSPAIEAEPNESMAPVSRGSVIGRFM